MKDIWILSIVIPIIAAIILAVCITAVGELYLALGKDLAITVAIVLMALITVIAAAFSLKLRGSQQ
ncbi:MAG TPA: hypothetical protein VFI42_04425 [Thermomicrobiaceae bacterium]|nr:hypothetical protein [Thermomicrobiaceae bacterium]